ADILKQVQERSKSRAAAEPPQTQRELRRAPHAAGRLLPLELTLTAQRSSSNRTPASLRTPLCVSADILTPLRVGGASCLPGAGRTGAGGRGAQFAAQAAADESGSMAGLLLREEGASSLHSSPIIITIIIIIITIPETPLSQWRSGGGGVEVKTDPGSEPRSEAPSEEPD
ncbi:hypothetical protein D4764_05G0009500, partial [Takifugu flavidus]